MSQSAPGRVRIGQQGRCFKLIEGGKAEGGLASGDHFADAGKMIEPPASHTDATAPRMSPEAIFMLAWGLGVAFGMLFMAFLIRAGVFA